MLLKEKPKGASSYDQSFLSAAAFPLEVLCLICIVCQATSLAMPFLSPDAANRVGHCTQQVLSLSQKICVGSILYGVVNVKIARSSRGIAKKSDILGAETSRQESQVLAVGQTARVLVGLGTVFSCLTVFNINLGTVASFCGLGGLAISLLSKGVIVNLIGSLTLFLTQPFTLGDWIQTVDGEVDGWVQTMGPYHTVVMRWDRRPLYIPNSRFMQVQIINASRMTNRRIKMDIPVRIADLDKIDGILDGIKDLIENHKKIDPEMHRLVRMRAIEEHAALIWVSCYTKSINLQEYVAVREDIILSIRNIMYKNGTTFATTLERELRRVNSSGALLGDSIYDGGSASLQSNNARRTAPDLAGMDVEVFKQPQQMDATQKALLVTELQRLKQLQGTLWARERDLKDAEGILDQENQRLQESRMEITSQQRLIETDEERLQSALISLSGKEDDLVNEEESLEAGAAELQAREDALDQLLRELRSQSLTETQVREAVSQGEREEILVEADRVIELHQGMLSKEKKVISQEREILKKEKAEIEELVASQAQQSADVSAERAKEEAGEDGGPQQDKDGKQDGAGAALAEATRIQKTAESLGGE